MDANNPKAVGRSRRADRPQRGGTRKRNQKKFARRKGFQRLLLSLCEGDTGKEPVRCLYYKRHHHSSEADEGKATIFVCNIPADFDFGNLNNIFSSFGSVESVEFTSFSTVPAVSLDSPRSARIQFGDESAVDSLNKFSSGGYRIPFEMPNFVSGMTKWLIEYKHERPDIEKLQSQVDRFMEAFDERVKEEKENIGKKEIDEDGFELVKRKSRRLKGSLSNSEFKSKKDTKKKKAPLVNFYKAQKRQQQQEKLALLRKKFEEDRKRIAEMRQARKFKPY